MRKRLESLLKAVGDADRILILPHNDPDPDAIASAVALRDLLAHTLGVEGQIAYKGFIGRAENRALVRYLGRPLRRLTSADLDPSVPIALVDTQPGTGNNALPPDRRATIILDHHPECDAANDAEFADLRSGMGATSTMLTQYLRAAKVDLTPSLSTALFYGIKTDTMGLSRGAGKEDRKTYFYLERRIDIDALVQIERALVPVEYYQSLVATLQAARMYDRILISYLGWMNYPGLAAEMADLLLRLNGIRWVVCLGAYKDELILSVRTEDQRRSAGRLAQEVVGDLGTAGGHGMMAGGQIPLQGRDPERLALQLGWQVLKHLNIESTVEGQPIV